MQQAVLNILKSHSRRVTAGAVPLVAALAYVSLLGGCAQFDFRDLLDDSHHGSGSGGASGGSAGAAGSGGAAQVCEFDGSHFAPGESFPSADGCNQCVCGDDGSVACTERACLAICGGLLGASCPDGQYCSFPPEAQCGAADQTGVCASQPEVCTFQYDPVCGCDDTTYGNACAAAAAGVSVSHPGECASYPACQSDSDCPLPPCACLDQNGDGVCDNTCPTPRCEGGQCTFADPTALQLGDSCGGFRPAGSPDCDTGLFCQFQPGALCGAADAPGECVAVPEVCNDLFAPVCGCDGQTYPNACNATANRIGILDVGACP